MADQQVAARNHGYDSSCSIRCPECLGLAIHLDRWILEDCRERPSYVLLHRNPSCPSSHARTSRGIRRVRLRQIRRNLWKRYRFGSTKSFWRRNLGYVPITEENYHIVYQSWLLWVAIVMFHGLAIVQCCGSVCT